MTEPRKLKRGLEDISPLFQKMIQKKAPEDHNACVPTGIQCFGVFSPDSPDDSLLFSTLIASQFAAKQYRSAVLSVSAQSVSLPVTSSTHHDFQHLSLTWKQFQKAWMQPIDSKSLVTPEHRLIFLDFDVMGAAFAHKINAMIDKWILIIQPNMESICESYRMIKSTLAFNQHLEYFMLYDGLPDDPRGTLVFEKLAEMTAAHLGINLLWLGCLHLGQGKRPITSELALEHLLLQPLKNHSSLEKNKINQMILPAMDPVEA